MLGGKKRSSPCATVFVHCACGTSMYAHSADAQEHVDMSECACTACGCQRFLWASLLNGCPHHGGEGISLKLELTSSAWLADQCVSGIFLYQPPQKWDYRHVASMQFPVRLLGVQTQLLMLGQQALYRLRYLSSPFMMENRRTIQTVGGKWEGHHEEVSCWDVLCTLFRICLWGQLSKRNKNFSLLLLTDVCQFAFFQIKHGIKNTIEKMTVGRTNGCLL